MAGKTIDDTIFQKASGTAAKSLGLEASVGEDKKIRFLEGKDTKAILYLDEGKIKRDDTYPESKTVEGKVREALMEALESSNVPAVRTPGRITSRSQAGSVPGSALDMVKHCQNTETATYSPGKGRTVASAKTNIAALMEAGGSLEILSREHRTDYIEYNVRASLPNGQHVDSSMSIFKQEYLAKKAWEWITKVLIKNPGIVTGVDEFGMPDFAPDAKISTRINDDGNSFVVELPAKIALWRELAREWQSAGRVCESKAYSRAADMLLRGDFQNREEKTEELSEVRAIQEKEGAMA